MVDHWDEYGPPIYMSAALRWGIKSKKTKKSASRPTVNQKENEENLRALAQSLISTGGEFHG